jgi:hypothetical protein
MYRSKYVIDILDELQMTYFKTNTTPFQSGVRLEDVIASPLVDCTRYQQLVGSLHYLKKSQLDITYVQFLGACRSLMSFTGRNKEDSQICQGDYQIWYTLCIMIFLISCWLYRLRLGGR